MTPSESTRSTTPWSEAIAAAAATDRRRLVAARFAVGGLTAVAGGIARCSHPAVVRTLERWAARIVLHAFGARLVVRGAHRVDPDERYVVVALHESLLDAPALVAALDLDLAFAVRDEIFRWSRLGRYLTATGHVEIPTDAGAVGYRRLLRAAPEIFERGDSLCVFPQGSVLGIEVAFRQGGFRLARHLGRPVLPVVVSGAHRLWEYPFSPQVAHGETVEVTVLDPIGPNAILDQVGALEGTMKSVALASRRAPPRRYVPERDGYWDGYRFEIDSRFPSVAAQVAAHRRDLAFDGGSA